MALSSSLSIHLFRYFNALLISLLTPIRLTLIPASDKRIKEYLATQTKYFKAEYEKALEELQSVHEELQSSRIDSDEQTNKFREALEEQKQKYKKQIEQIRNEERNLREKQVEKVKKTISDISSDYFLKEDISKFNHFREETQAVAMSGLVEKNQNKILV